MSITIASRFRGPPASGNGGYSCGVIGELIRGPAEVTLRKPPPLDVPLDVVSGETVRLLQGDTLIGEGKPASLVIDVPEPPSFEDAAIRAEHYVGFHAHPYPSCFVCGPQREPGDALRIFPGRHPGEPLVAAPWVPLPGIAGEDGNVARAIVWAALDCPGYFSALSGEAALLGRMTAEVITAPRVGDRCVVIGWKIGIEDRKVHAGTAVFGPSGELLGRAKQTWILLKS